MLTWLVPSHKETVVKISGIVGAIIRNQSYKTKSHLKKIVNS